MKLLRFCWILMNMCLPKFDIYQSTVALNYFKSHTNYWCSDFFQKKFCLMSDLKFTTSDVTSSLPDNLSDLWKIMFRLNFRGILNLLDVFSFLLSVTLSQPIREIWRNHLFGFAISPHPHVSLEKVKRSKSS